MDMYIYHILCICW